MGLPTDLPQMVSSTNMLVSSTATVDDFWESHLLMDRLPACGPVPVVESKVPSEIETMDDWEAEVEISPCLDARPVMLRWEYRCEGCAWQLLETALVDLDSRPSVVRLNAFTFQAETNHEIMVSASYEETFSPNTSLLFPLHILPKRRPVAIVSGPHVVSQSCRFTLSARKSRDVSSASAVDFFYAWSVWEAESLQDMSHLLTQLRAVDLDVAAGTFPLGRYVVKLQLWRRAETINHSGETQFQLFVGAQAMPVVSIESSWLPGDRVSTEADSTNITARIGLSSPDCLVENLSAWSWRWLLLEDRSQDVVADFGAMSDGQTLVMSTSNFHDFAMISGEQYSYGVAGIPASFTSYGFAELFGLGLTLSKSNRFTADAPPGGGTVEARPCRVTSIASPITYRTFGWQDEDPEGLEYAFFRFSAAIIASETAEGAAIDRCEDRLALPEIQWEDVTSPNYFRALGGVMLRDWAKSPWLQTLMPSGKFYILVRARDSVGGKADSPWLLGVVVGSEAMDATEMTSLLNAQVVTGDAQRIFSSVEAILSMGTNSGATTMQQADFLRALQVASETMDPTAESMEEFASIVGEVASLAPVNNETGHAATSMLRRILTLPTTNAFHDRRVATSMFNAIGKVTENTPEDVLGDPQGFQGEVQALALALGDAMVSNMENESFASLTNSQMQLEVSKSKRLVTAAGCISCDSEHIQKGRLHMETETMMAGSRRLQGSPVLQTVTVTAKLLVWKDFKVGHLDPRKGFNSIVPNRVDAIVTEIDQDCIGTEPLIHTIGTRHMWPSDPQPAMTRTTCAQFNETEVVWSEAVTEIYGKKVHVDCFSSPSCGTGVQRTTSTVLHAPDVWGTFADAMFFLWICLLILVVAITLAVTVILSVYKFETHVKHVAGPPLGRRRQSKQEGPKAHAWSVVPAQIEHRAEISSSEPSGSEDLLEIPRARISAVVNPSPKTLQRPSFASRGPTFEQGRVGSDDLLGPLDSGPVSEVPRIDPPEDAVMLGRPQEALQELTGSAALILSEEVGRKQSSVREAWG